MIRAAGPAEAGALADLHAQCFPPPEAWGPDAMRLMLEMPGAFALMVPEQALVLARVAADEAEILTLCVVPSARQQGLGQALMAAAMAAAAARGAGAMFLEVAAGNIAAQRLYSAMGFVAAGRRRRYYADGGDALVMRRALSAS